ncbi:hypothetical protein ARMSODRAFT_741891 [Armillaria solidipes]|uniref:Uncharacterized protein n=1 Tax=Armillaria solidipes TaxID=1076256 RepID=A0A2H3C179_9AGAR|nr:hypothetical protein ARMSODRAFT_741891 [Armillaria solidipes]
MFFCVDLCRNLRSVSLSRPLTASNGPAFTDETLFGNRRASYLQVCDRDEEQAMTSAPTKFDTNHFCPIEALCPLDRVTVDTRLGGRYVPDISDRELFSQRFLWSRGIRSRSLQIAVVLAVLAARAQTRQCAAYTQLLIRMSAICYALRMKDFIAI